MNGDPAFAERVLLFSAIGGAAVAALLAVAGVLPVWLAVIIAVAWVSSDLFMARLLKQRRG